MTQTSMSLFDTAFRLNLERPLAFFDLETTGINVNKDRIVEISILKVMPDGSKTSHTYRVNPLIPISAESTKVHGISNEDVKDKKTFAELAPELMEIFENCDLAGYNSNKFDIPLLMEEFQRANINFQLSGRKLVDVQNIFHKMEQRTLSAAYRFYCNTEIEKAHSAEADIFATYEVLLAQLQKYTELRNDVSHLHQFSMQNNCVDLSGRIIKNEQGIEVFNFGKHKGKAVEEIFRIERPYYDWMMKGEFAIDTKAVITEILKRMENKTP